MSFGAQFLAGQRFAQGLVETYRDAKQRRELGDIAKAKPVELSEFDEAQGQQIEAAAADGTKHIGYDDKIKAYMATPKLADGEVGPAQPVEIARQKPMTEFLGKKTPGAMTPEQVTGARQLAMADVVSKSDPIQGMRLQREVKQGEREDKRWMREDRKATEEEDFQKGYQAEYGQTNHAKNMGQYAAQVQAYEKYQAQIKGGADPATLGAPPPMPTRPVYSEAESLADSGRLLAFKASKGKADPAEILQYAERLQKVSNEGYGKALKLAQGGAPLEKVIEQFNQTGKVKLDPAAVVSDQMVSGADGVPARVIKVRDASGNVQTINALSELDAIGQAENYFNRFDKNRTFDLNERKTAVAERQAATSERKLDMVLMRGMGGGGSGSGGRAGAQDGGGTTSFDPLAQFDSKKAQAVAFEQAAAAVDANGKPLTPAEQGKLAQQIYRSMEDAFATENTQRQRATVFRTEARNASTPEEIEAVRQRAAASGYTDAEMAALDKRFAAKAPEPTNKQEAPTRSSADASKPEPKPASIPVPAYGRPATGARFFGSSEPRAEIAPAAAPAPATAKSPQTLGDDFQSPMARQALQIRVAAAAEGGPPLTSIERLRAQQLGLIR